jgi:hypothetical protein
MELVLDHFATGHGGDESNLVGIHTIAATAAIIISSRNWSRSRQKARRS